MELQKKVLIQAERVASYVDHSITLPFALMAVPDSIFSFVSIDVISRAYKQGVHILSYSMTAPFLLTFYSLCLQYAAQIDPTSLNTTIERIIRDCEKIRGELENKVAKGQTMINNAYSELISQVHDIEEAIYQLRIQSDTLNQDGIEIQ